MIAGRRQWLVIGDSISLGYLSAASAAAYGWQVVHAGGTANNDNIYWHTRCMSIFLGNASRWDAVSLNAGLHDLAYPDNEHLSLETYESLLTKTLSIVTSSVRKSTQVVWMRTTPVPTNPPEECVLIPGRLESDVLAYNGAADKAVLASGSATLCDLHKVITECAAWDTATVPLRSAGAPILARRVSSCWERLLPFV